MGLYQYYKDAPAIGKGAIILTGVAVVAFTGIGINRAVKRHRAGKGAREYTQDIEDDIEEEVKTTGKDITKNKTNFVNLAIKAYKALNKINTDEVAVYQVFAQMNNDADVLTLIKTFGSPLDTSESSFFPTAPKPLTLGGFISTKMNGEEVTALNNMLARKAIKYRF